MINLLSALPRRIGVVLCAKGLGPDGRRLSRLAAELGFGRVAVLSGPNHAEEIGLGLPAATVVASQDAAFAASVQRELMVPSLRVYTSSDVAGVELGGVLKNVMAVAAGMGDGLHLGDNARASVITRGLREMSRYLASQGAHEDTVYGLSSWAIWSAPPRVGTRATAPPGKRWHAARLPKRAARWWRACGRPGCSPPGRLKTKWSCRLCRRWRRWPAAKPPRRPRWRP